MPRIQFNCQALGEQIEVSGFDPTVRSFFIWAGVSNYLTSAAVDATLRYCANAAAGSQIIFTCVHRGVLDGSVPFVGTQNLVATLQRAGESWTFGIDPADAATFLADRGLELMEDVGAAEYRARHLGPAARSMQGYEFYRVVLAEMRGASTARAVPATVNHSRS